MHVFLECTVQMFPSWLFHMCLYAVKGNVQGQSISESAHIAGSIKTPPAMQIVLLEVNYLQHVWILMLMKQNVHLLGSARVVAAGTELMWGLGANI